MKPPSKIRRPPSQAPLQAPLRSSLQAPLRSLPFSSPLQAPLQPFNLLPSPPPPGAGGFSSPLREAPPSQAPLRRTMMEHAPSEGKETAPVGGLSAESPHAKNQNPSKILLVKLSAFWFSSRGHSKRSFSPGNFCRTSRLKLSLPRPAPASRSSQVPGCCADASLL